MSDSHKHTLGSAITLTKGVAYTTPSDGYFRIRFNAYAVGSTERAEGMINSDDRTMMAITGNTAYSNASLFVRKGTIIKYGGTDKAIGEFEPLV